MAGLEGPVRIRRDRWGVPHVGAGSREDLWFAQGFCHAQDRLWQMDFYRRVVRGRVSEIAGEEGLAVDRLMRTLGSGARPSARWRELDPEQRSPPRRLLRGRQRRRRAGPGPAVRDQMLRLDFEPWRPVTCSASASCSPSGSPPTGSGSCCAPTWSASLGPSWTRSSTPATRRATRSSPRSRGRATGSGLAEQIGRSATRSGGRRGERLQQLGRRRRALSATGGPLIAGDPHLSPSMPGIWHQVGLGSATASSAAPRCPGCPASTWARTTTSPGPSPT